MEVRNITPAQSSPAFGMAFIKPSKKVMEVLEKQVNPEHLEAFVKEQAKSKYFDITANLDHSYYQGKDNAAILFNIVPKEGVDTFGYGEKYGFHSEGNFKNYKEAIVSRYREDIKDLSEKANTGFKKFFLKRIFVPIYSRCASKEIKNVEKNHPERMVLPALRAAGDKVWDLEYRVDRAAGISKIFEG